MNQKGGVFMSRHHRVIASAAGLTILLSLWGTAFVPFCRSENFQNVPILLRAPDLLPKEVLSGPNYTVQETVKNDGFIHVYEVNTQYGHLKVESTALLLKRVAELRALMKLEQLQGTSLYADALKKAAMGPVRTAESLVTAPVETVVGIGTGIGNFFGKVSDAVTSNDPHKDSALNNALGQSAFKREFAYNFGVDPYTPYQPLQKTLSDVAWTSAAGGLTAKTAFMAIPGGAGAVIGYSGTADTMKGLVRDKTPAELQRINGTSLRNMNIVDPVASRFLSNASFGPQDKTFIVGALASMAAVKDRGIFIKSAVMECDESLALFIQIRAEMMARYFQKYRNVDRFVSAGGMPLLLTKDRVIVGLFPLDHVAWTAGFSRKEASASDAIEKMKGIKGKELWISGTVDPAARAALEGRGWKVEEKANNKLK
jgi:hypothetical protein